MPRTIPPLLAALLFFVAPVTASAPRLLLIGDSTVASYAKPPADRPTLTGWGQVFGEFFKDGVQIDNRAVSGASSKSFLTRFGTNALKSPADWVFIQFGQNDQPGKGDRTTRPEGDYQDFLRRYINDARAKGMKPVLVTPVARRIFADGKPATTLTPYAEAMKKVATAEKVPLIDLYAASLALYARLGDEGSAGFSPSASDRTHFSRTGALEIARLVADAAAKQLPDLAPFLKPAPKG